MKILFFALLFNIQYTSLENDINHPNTSFEEKIDIEKIFFMDEESQLLFIDLESISTTVFEVKVLQNKNDVWIEDVKDLDQNMIYEIDLTLLNSGEYIVELIIENHSNIQIQLIVE